MPIEYDEFSFRTRLQALRRFQREKFDLLIIGGGITGAATARDASSRGLKVALVDRHDFAWGTSSRSSKLVHGGLRYLENFEMKLVFEALAERALLLRETARGADHPSVAATLDDYAALLRQMGRGQEAEPMEERARAIRASGSGG